MVINQLLTTLSSCLTQCIFVEEYCVEAYLLILGLAVILVIAIILSVHRWSKQILNTIRQDDNFDDLNRIWSRRGLQYWTRHFKLLWTLRYRWFKSWIVLRVYSSHQTIAKGIVAVVVSFVAYSESSQSPVIAGATVFYATMIFLQSTSEYAALWTQSITMTRYDYDGVTDSLGVSTEVDNLGLKTANNISAKLRLIDGPRKLSGSTTPDQRRNDSKLEPKLSTDYSFTFAGENDTMGNVMDRIAMNGELGEIAFVVVEIQTPDQPVKTVRYRNISNAETTTQKRLQEMLEGLGENLSVLDEFTRRKYANKDAGEVTEIGSSEDDEDSRDTDESR